MKNLCHLLGINEVAILSNNESEKNPMLQHSQDMQEKHQLALEENQWQALLVFNLYRVGLAIFLIALRMAIQ